MSVLRGLHLRLSLTKSLTQSKYYKSIILTLLLIGLLTAIAFSTQFDWRGLAARRSNADRVNSIPTSLEKLPPVSTRGPVLADGAAVKYSSHPAAPFQGCTVNCTATVPATGQSGADIPFQATATASGCSTQPAYEWNFGDGQPQSNQQNPTHKYLTPGPYTWTLTTSVGGGSTSIDTIVGGLGEGNAARQAPFGVLGAIARDPQNRGVYVSDAIGNNDYIRFINTGTSEVTIAGKTIAPGTVRAIAGGGNGLEDNIDALKTSLGTVAGLGVSGDGNILYYTAKTDLKVRGINVSSSTQTVGSQSIGVGRVTTLASGFGDNLSGLAVKTSTGEVFVCDATAGINKVFKISPQGQSSDFAGNAMPTDNDAPFSAGLAKNIPLLQPRAVRVGPNGDVFIGDTGHGRVIRVDAGGSASLVNQFTVGNRIINPYPSGIAVQGGNAFVANGNQLNIVRVTGGVTVIAGLATQTGQGISCDYSSSSCGDGGPASGASFNFIGSTSDPQTAGIESSDSSGLFILDQGQTGRGRVRYINLAGGPVTLAGTTIAAGAIETIAGSGAIPPYDGGSATAATFNTPVGVAVDGNGNLWISDTNSAKLRFANRGSSALTIFSGTPAQQIVPAGGIVTVNKDVGTSGTTDGGPVNQAGFDSPQGLFITSQGVYVADSRGGRTVPQDPSGRRTSLIRFINTTNTNVTLFPGSSSPIIIEPGEVLKIAGGSENSTNGDGQFATNAKFIGTSDLVVTANGTIYVTDVGQNAVRKIDGQTGLVSSVSGLAPRQHTGLGLDSEGRLYVANYEQGTVLRENTAGSGSFTAIASNLTKPRDVAVAADGTAYVTVGQTVFGMGAVDNNQIVQIPAGGSASVVAGSTAGFVGDGGPASAAMIDISPSPLVVGSGMTNQLPETVNIVANGIEILFTDSNNNRIRRISPSQTTCVKTGTIMIQGDNPVPNITSINPTSANQNSGALTLTVVGTGFVPTTIVRWKGQDRVTTFVSNSQLTAQITATDTATAGPAAITVFSPTPGGGTSNSVNFNVTGPNPIPMITSINPNTVAEGSPGFTLAVTGSNFVNNSEVRLDGQSRTTTFVSATQLTALIPPGDLVGTGTAAVTVFNPTPAGGLSNSVGLTIGQGGPVVTSVSAASFALGQSMAPDSIAAAFGTGLAEGTVLATSLPLPQTLGVTSVEVQDSANVTRNAGLFFVSPLQLNYQIPAATALGTATVTVKRNGNPVGRGTISVDMVQPGLFSANATGTGLAAAVVLRRRGGVDTFEAIATYNATTQSFDAIPLDLGLESDLVFFVGFGTGFRNGAQTNVSAMFDTTASPFVGIGAVGGFASLDQANMQIPRSLAGRNGLVDVVLMVSGKASNAVKLFIK